MIIKVCGMKHAENMQQLSKLDVDYIGMIFYAKSPRFLDKVIDCKLPTNIKKVGVFVNADKDYMQNTIATHQLDMVQLHGNESPALCKELSPIVSVIKAFSIAAINDLEATNSYIDVCDTFLFDTKTPQYGGSGYKFDWTMLDHYTGNKPFLLSGGISEDDAEAIKKINHPAFIGIDLNSRFEIEAGLKDINKLEKFINEIQS